MWDFKNKLEINTEENTSLNEDEIEILNISMKNFRRSLTNRMKQANGWVSRHKVKNCNNKKRKKGKIYEGQPHRIGTYRKCGTPLKY